ncbi:hypothetical protein C1Y63_02290 [Corynebacterium sp. 13CS0277]|uniref:hypothetical protein n=1 Tax=Corynebacterium sp. 13CS0277 TaxID=2071994 RepID=UPI000D048203|nr:hypothetical protein [Corynebacterium sp. 13CS0277]PRQ12161.1 hypothetical protein C1Y63_02290 [Corynebacterium sp. 13CS0277]
MNIAAAEDAMNRAMRAPKVLRAPEVLAAHAAHQAARAEHRLGATAPLEVLLGVYGTLDAGLAARLRTQPLSVVARLDVLLGGDGTPDTRADALLQVGPLIRSAAHPLERTAAVHALLLEASPFGPRSGTIARATARLVAIHTGADAAGIAHTETHLARHPQRYAAATGEELMALYIDAFAAGARDAELLARNL